MSGAVAFKAFMGRQKKAICHLNEPDGFREGGEVWEVCLYLEGKLDIEEVGSMGGLFI